MEILFNNTMSQSFFKTVKNFFNSKTSNYVPPPVPTTKSEAPRVAHFSSRWSISEGINSL